LDASPSPIASGSNLILVLGASGVSPKQNHSIPCVSASALAVVPKKNHPTATKKRRRIDNIRKTRFKPLKENPSTRRRFGQKVEGI
jgi:hypothetical protein